MILSLFYGSGNQRFNGSWLSTVGMVVVNPSQISQEDKTDIGANPFQPNQRQRINPEQGFGLSVQSFNVSSSLIEFLSGFAFVPVVSFQSVRFQTVPVLVTFIDGSG